MNYTVPLSTKSVNSHLYMYVLVKILTVLDPSNCTYCLYFYLPIILHILSDIFSITNHITTLPIYPPTSILTLLTYPPTHHLTLTIRYSPSKNLFQPTNTSFRCQLGRDECYWSVRAPWIHCYHWGTCISACVMHTCIWFLFWF